MKTDLQSAIFLIFEMITFGLQAYGQNCWNVGMDRLYDHLDIFAVGHAVGWGLKALVVRHYGILWSVSIMWEFTEV